MNEYINEWDECEYLKIAYEEWDTGYKEYECTLFGGDCMGKCPLTFKYKIED